MIKVNRIVYAAFETPDLDGQVDHYTKTMGLTLMDRDSSAAYLSSSGDRHTVVLRKGAEARCDALGFQLPQGTDLGEYAKQIAGHGIQAQRQSDCQPGIKDSLVFVDSKGTKVETFVEAPIAGIGFQPSGISPNKLGHVAFNAVDVQAAVKFYCEVLGFKVSDWMGDFFAFLRCGPDHHTINLVSGAKNKMHHIAFELRDWTHIRDACDWLATDRIPVIWGPVRHGIGHNISTYHRNADGQIIELFCELDRVNESLEVYEPRRVHQEFPQKGKVWTDKPMAANMWGSMPPEGFLD
ncbi:glyoxalase [Rhizobium rhizogenes]|uniref:Glyoxalase/Bleomycin resistance protein n=1 Tax=Rhizobium rhizogenes (strain K84 / ATCC BAA-868) TaxID=311403 RepID=B9JM43_RHIR8|nr:MULTISPECIES: VOC family protein [Rhizobium]ACM28757.1 Glyoxalase/Bleomycin resistance protein [Rhizobium rhizogenes K84]OCJ18978.1 glyoxalase [Agrobacterium sp. B131/95]EJK88054.1 putative ring-cleavage extradiol dioxygenase [Rhizobium sp. AP16]NTI24430.1 glyoxalase [Rhizobium rhizogenes]NTI43750.1 glyoxalase [Rhizobium rhizogenes]